MGAMKNGSNAIQGHANSRTAAFGDLGAEGHEKSLNVPPCNIASVRPLEDPVKRFFALRRHPDLMIS